MNFDWNTYIDLAKALNAMPQDSAKRSAVSRAYYGVFHAASNTLKANGVRSFPKDNRRSHIKIWNVYKKSAKRACRKIGLAGGRLMDDRHKADYEASETFDPVQVATLITEAESLVTSIGVPANLPEGFVGPVPPAGSSSGAIAKVLHALKRRFLP